MMGPSDLYRVPRCASPSQTEATLRYARLEHDAESLAWAVPAASSVAPRFGIRAWFASLLRLPRASVAQPVPLRSGLAAVHFGGEASLQAPIQAETDHPCATVATSALLVTVQSRETCADDVCTCEH